MPIGLIGMHLVFIPLLKVLQSTLTDGYIYLYMAGDMEIGILRNLLLLLIIIYCTSIFSDNVINLVFSV